MSEQDICVQVTSHSTNLVDGDYLDRFGVEIPGENRRGVVTIELWELSQYLQFLENGEPFRLRADRIEWDKP